MSFFTPLDGNQTRQAIDTEQLFDAYRHAQTERDQRYRGSMMWKTVSGRDYLYRKAPGGEWKSLGRRGPESERAYEAFRSGRAAIRERIKTLDERIRRIAPVNRALGLGRVPRVGARILRQLEGKNLLGKAVSVVGTHALYAYERMAGGHFDQSHVATLDIDLLYDARARLRLSAPEARETGLKGLLHRADASFEPIVPGGFRAVNASGFIVDLITPMPALPASGQPARIGSDPADMTAAEIQGLGWLQNCPQAQQTVIDEGGYPVRLHVPDPRAFALHKLWVSERPDRDRMKARRDAAQAVAVAELVLRYLPQLRFDGSDLQALPAELRARAPDLLAMARRGGEAEPGDW